MFEPGQKFVIVASSRKKKVGVRTGSVGYFSQQSSYWYHKKENVFLTLCSGVFVRYGFEKNHRLESKDFVTVIPLINKNDITTIQNTIEDSCSMVNILEEEEEKTTTKPKINNFREMIGLTSQTNPNYKGKTPFVVAVPIIAKANDNLLSCGKHDLLAWIDSISSNNETRLFLAKSIGRVTSTYKETFKQPFTYENLVTTLTDKWNRIDVVERVVADMDFRKTVINSIRLLQIATRGSVIKSLQKFDTEYTRHEVSLNSVCMISLYSAVINHLFNNLLMRQLIHNLRKGDKQTNIAADCVEEMLSCYHRLFLNTVR